MFPSGTGHPEYLKQAAKAPSSPPQLCHPAPHWVGWEPPPDHNLPASWRLPRGQEQLLCHPAQPTRISGICATSQEREAAQLAWQGPCAQGRNSLALSKGPVLEMTPCADTRTPALYSDSFPIRVYLRTPAVRKFIKLSHCGGINVPR